MITGKEYLQILERNDIKDIDKMKLLQYRKELRIMLVTSGIIMILAYILAYFGGILEW